MKKGRVMKISISLALAAVIFLSSYSCTESRDAAQRGGTLIIGETSAYESLNPMQTTDSHARDIYQQLFLLLLKENSDLLTFSPRLAESWEFSGDRSKLTFHLRDGVFWSDGVKVTAHDVKATYQLQIDPSAVWSGRHLKKYIDSVQVIDDLTVVYHFNHIYPYQIMDVNDGPILPKHFIEKYQPAMIGAVPVEEFPVNGPFRIEKWDKGQSLTLVPNESYYERGKPYLSKVIFKIIPDQMTLITQLRAGEIDCMETAPPAEVEMLRSKYPDLRIIEYDGRGYVYIGWNGARPPFDNVKVRRALSHAIDRKMIIDNLYYGLAKECIGPFPPVIWAYDPDIEPIPHDPVKASRILAEEGFKDTDGDGYLEKDGRRFEFELLTNQGNQIRADIQIMVQEQLKKIGVKVIPVTMEWTVMLSKHKAADFDAIISAWSASTKADLSPIWSCEARKEGGYNRVEYCNPVVDSLNALACSKFDFDEARPLFYKAQRMIYDEQPYTFLYVRSELLILHKRFRDAEPDAISSFHNLHEWWIEGEKRPGN
ncbi:MAG: peptide-binding protein [Candidatus Krumholzibacteriota bacterium]|nr:peptide-binding protein [Candidatus Krumholzibacteriota bacterium]